MGKQLFILGLLLIFVLKGSAQTLSSDEIALQDDSINVQFVLLGNDDSPYDVGSVYVYSNNNIVARSTAHRKGYVFVRVPKIAYKDSMSVLKIYHRLYKEKDIQIALRTVAFNTAYNNAGEIYELPGGCRLAIKIRRPLMGDPFEPSKTTFTSEEIEKMAH